MSSAEFAHSMVSVGILNTKNVALTEKEDARAQTTETMCMLSNFLAEIGNARKQKNHNGIKATSDLPYRNEMQGKFCGSQCIP